jgi:tetratricopeptide (TPR) repeat protein
MTAQESKETGQRLFKSRQYTEAIPLLKLAAETFPNNETLWQELVLAAHHCAKYGEACESAKQAVRQHPRSGWLWRQLGCELTLADRLDEAAKAFDNARSILGHSDEWLWRYQAALCRKQKNLEGEINALENLHDLDMAGATDLNQLGMAYHNSKPPHFAKALEFYRLAATADPNTAYYFNMGLVFSHSEISQDADAADVYRRALALKPDYESARKNLAATRDKLAPLAAMARRTASALIQKSEHFQFYLSPFEVLQIAEFENAEVLDVKTIQRAKKRLLQEIELNDGKVSWLDDYALDKSRALALEDEILNESKRPFHLAIFKNKPLLRFLTRGDVEHFLYSDDYFPQQSLELLDEEPEFRDFLSKPFANQYNLLLSRAIEQRAIPVIETLFDGRRWVNQEDEDICFAGAYKRVGELVRLMRAKAAEGEERKISVQELEDFLRQHSFTNLFNLLPTAFRTAQSELVAEIRQLAVSSYNEHSDADLSRGVLNLCKGFRFKSVELNKRLDEDFKTIEQKIAEERKAEVRLQFGPERPFQITKEGIKDGAKFFPANTIQGFRWGITVTGYTGAERYEYLLVVKNDAGENATAAWSTSKADETKQTEWFSSMVNACLNYLAEAAVEKIRHRLTSGSTVLIGPYTLSQQGISFQTQGFIFKKNRFVSWADVSTEIRNGQVVVSSKSQQGVMTSASMIDTDNAVLLPFLRSVMEKQRA